MNSEDTAQGIIYFDDEESNDYEEKNKFFMKKIHFQKNELFIAHITDDFKISNKIEKIIITGLKRKIIDLKFMNFAEAHEEDLEFVQNGDITCIKRANISMENLWKIKFNYLEN